MSVPAVIDRDEPRRRFVEHHKAKPEFVAGLASDHPAVVDMRSLFPSTVVEPKDSPRLLVSGANSRKIGDRVVKGPWEGMPIYTLSLEERTTCPETCHHILTCYGNGMPMARRHRHGPDLVEKLDAELAQLNTDFPKGFVVRLHVLGDFYSVEYVDAWLVWLEKYAALHVFGYTAWQAGTPIGDAIIQLRDGAWDRFAVRTSAPKSSPSGATTIWRAPEGSRVAEGIVCPAQTDKTACCGSCGLCWAPAAKDETIVFIAHGRTIGARTPFEPVVQAADPGPKPEMGWLPVARLSVDERYQRNLDSRRSQALIATLVQKFNWSAFQAIVATQSGEGWLVIDGGHRVEAARRRGETHVPAVIVKAQSVEEQAAIFVHANQNRVAVNAFALYHARLAAGDPSAKATAEFCERHGLSIPRYPVPLSNLKPGQTLALKAVEKIARDPDDRFGRRAVALLQACWPSEAGGVSGLLLRSTASILEEFPEEEERLRAFLAKQPPSVWAEEYAGRGGVDMLREDLRMMISGDSSEKDDYLAPTRAGFVHVSDERVDPSRHSFIKDGGRLRCSPKEWSIFEMLAESGGRLVSNDRIYQRLYGDDIDGGADPKIVDVFVCKLRKVCPFEIETIWGEGYILNGYKMQKVAPDAHVVSGIDRARLMAGR